MKKYPSILGNKNKDVTFEAYIFDKLDGSNLRFEWDSKKGWHKFGTRNRMFDETDPIFGKAIPLFLEQLADPVAQVANRQNWKGLTVFAEFWGDRSFAGEHHEDDEKRLTLFDANPYKKGILGPEQFLDLFGTLAIPKFLGKREWSPEFVQAVRNGMVDGVTFEGVVGKAGEGHKLMMRKAKTQAWVDKVLEKYGATEGEKIINS